MRARFSLRHLLDDLHKLEINTIEKSNLTAQKMPAPLLALHDIVDSYEAYEHTGGAYDLRVPDDNKTGETIKNRLSKMVQRAQNRIRQLATDPTHQSFSRRAVYLRIRNSCIFLIGVLERSHDASCRSTGDERKIRGRIPRKPKNLADTDHDTTGRITGNLLSLTGGQLRKMERRRIDESWQLSVSDRAQIRKIWEIGTETVLVQTVIDIEGDVLTRINPHVAEGTKPQVLEIHQSGIETSMKMWSNLIAVAGKLLEALGRTVSLRR